MKRASLLLHTLRHTRPGQLLARARLLAARHALATAARAGWAPTGWQRAAAPPVRSPTEIAGGLFSFEGERRPLPAQVDLAGTPWTIAARTDWHPAALERGTRLEKLNLHYMEYLTSLQPRAAAEVMLDWIDQNPPYRAGYWKDGWNAYALSIRVVVWMDLLGRDGRLDVTPAERAQMLQSLAAQLRFLAANLEHDIGGNHLLRDLRALLRGGRFFTGPEAEGWHRTAAARLRAELAEQVLPDGMHFELSPAYHVQVMIDLLDAWRALGSHAAARAEVETALARMAQVTTDLTHPDGRISLFADGGLHMTESPEAVLAAHRRLVPTAARVSPRRKWRLPHGGYVGLRSDDELLIVDCGPVGPDHLPAHGHGDALAFEWSVRGRRLIVDAGVFEYHAGPLRAYSRSTRAHNTVTLDDQDQSEFWSAFRVARRARAWVEAWDDADPGRLTLAAAHDGYRRLPGAPVHRRTIDAAAGRLRVRDRIEGGSGQAVAGRLLLAPDVQVALAEGGALLTQGDVRIRLTTGARVTREEGLWMPDFGVKQAAPRLVLDYGRAPGGGEFTLEVLG